MEFQTLSHAGLRVAAAGCELLVDPWLVGSAYWRSWWNYPPVPEALVASLRPDFIYLTHIHWDHFHAPSLRRFSPDTPVIVPYDRYGRMVRDLAAVGMTRVIELKHGARHELAPGFSLQSYHFSPIVTDSAAVIVADGVTLFNANDAKLAGGPLQQVLDDHPAIDFAFRSHSSANPRANYHFTDAPDARTDDNTHYLRAFALFMQRVRPRYAIPFASNNCLLHDDVWAMNALVQTPIAMRDYFEAFAREHSLATWLQIMAPGDRWTRAPGETQGRFDIADTDWQTNRTVRLAEYRDRVRPTLAAQAKIEARVTVPVAAVRRYFAKLSADLPGLFVRSLRGHKVLLVAKSEKALAGFAVDLVAGTTEAVDPADFRLYPMRVEFPALILLQSLAMNMFGHAAISKRVHYYAPTDLMPVLKRFVAALELAEYELVPLSRHFNKRTVAAALPRWREGLLYARVLGQLARGRDFPTIEESLLQA